MEKSRRDIVVIGGSAGGGRAVREVTRSLPAGFTGTIFVVLHVPAHGSQSHTLGELLCGEGNLACELAEDGKPFEPAHIYIAPPDTHLLIGRDAMQLTRGPLENRARPAIDPMFRSAAASHDSRVIGIVLSGYLNDGAAGLKAIKRCGGLAVVQQPSDAAVPDMPQSALDAIEVDYVLPAARIGILLTELAQQPAPPGFAIPEDIRIEAGIAANHGATMTNEFRLGDPSTFSCPDCGGVLWRIEDGKLTRFRCHTGHAYTQETLSAAQAENVDKALWSALRALREKVATLDQLAVRAEHSGQRSSADRYQAVANEYRGEAERILSLLSRTTAPDLAAAE